MQKNSRTYVTIILFLGIGIGIGIGWGIHVFMNPINLLQLSVPVRENSNQFKFINPLIFSKTNKVLYEPEFSDLNTSLGSYIDNVTGSNVDSVSVYYRDLNDGHWTGINEEDKYEPASILKVLVMISVLKQALAEPNLLSKYLPYAGPIDTLQYYKPSDNLSIGSHTVEELINAMIIDSNNGAAKSLLDNKDINDSFQDAYKTFLLPQIASATTTDYMSARSYSVIFRTLYDSTYLTWDLSEQALSLLTDTGYSKGILAGVPLGTVVAHKFGEYTKVAADGSVVDHELHDCGIVYYPNNPYLLCVMTRGKDFGHLEETISDTSKLVFEYAKSKYSGAKK